MKTAHDSARSPQSDRATGTGSKAGRKGAAVEAPCYGLDFVDRGITAAAASSLPVQLRAGAEGEKLPQRKSAPVQRMESAADSTPRENHTGLPNRLKSGVESLSGLAMDHVRVHYNSSRPAQLRALAYAQGSDIHVAPGQEKHLPHEAWHIVQQAQGRVQPTMQMKSGVQVNDETGLEREAEVMGAKALQMRRSSGTAAGPATHSIEKRHAPSQLASPVTQMAGYLGPGGLEEWKRDTTTKKLGSAVSRQTLLTIDRTLAYLNGLTDSEKTKPNIVNDLRSFREQLAGMKYVEGDKSSATAKARAKAIGKLIAELDSLVAPGEEQEIKELLRVGFGDSFLRYELSKTELASLSRAHRAFMLGDLVTAEEALNSLSPMDPNAPWAGSGYRERAQRADERKTPLWSEKELIAKGWKERENTNKDLIWVERKLIAYHADKVGGIYSRVMTGKISREDISQGEEFLKTRHEDYREADWNWARGTAKNPNDLNDEKGTGDLSIWLRTLGPGFSKLTEAEAMAIRLYTTAQYHVFNSAMMDMNVGNLSQRNAFEGHVSLNALAVSGLSKLPPFRGTVYRGEYANRVDLRHTTRPGTDFIVPSLWSSTKDEQKAFDGTIGIVIKLRKAGRYVAPMSQFTVGKASEFEVLILPGTRLRVENTYWGQDRNYDNGGSEERLRKAWSADDYTPLPDEVLTFLKAFRFRTTVILMSEA